MTTLTTTFPLPLIPASAPRRTWALSATENVRYGLVWYDLLCALDPTKTRKLSPTNALGCYEALCRYINKNMFPLFEVNLELAEAEEGDLPEAYAFEHGIPCDVLGFDYELLESGSCSPAVTLCAFFQNSLMYQGSSAYLENNEVTARYLDDLRPFIERAGMPEGVTYSPRPGRNREWIASAWQGIGDLCDYVSSNTGYAFLDWSHFEIMDGNEYPRWNMGELKGLMADWQHTKPIWKRITDLIAYVDSRPAQRLPLLAGVLAGDKATLASLTTPKRSQPKTLAEVFLQ